MSDEQYAQYQVHGSQLRYAKAQLDANGIPISAITPQVGGMYIIIIPAAYASFDHHAAAPRRRAWWMPSRKTLVTLAMIAVAGVGAYMLFSGGIKITGVSVPTVAQLPTMPALPELPALPKTVELPSVPNPLAGVNASLNETAASINRTADAAKNAAITFLWIVGGLIAAIGLWALRGPLSAVGHGIGGIAGMIGKAVRRG